MAGLLVRAVMDGGSGCALPKGTWFGVWVRVGLNSSPCTACSVNRPVAGILARAP